MGAVSHKDPSSGKLPQDHSDLQGLKLDPQRVLAAGAAAQELRDEASELRAAALAADSRAAAIEHSWGLTAPEALPYA